MTITRPSGTNFYLNDRDTPSGPPLLYERNYLMASALRMPTVIECMTAELMGLCKEGRMVVFHPEQKDFLSLNYSYYLLMISSHERETALSYLNIHLQKVGVIEFSPLWTIESQVEQGNTDLVEMLSEDKSNCE